MRCGVLIPAYEPGEALPALTRALMDKGVPVVVVNDGSATGLEYFERIRAQGAVVLEHGENLGKGRALKTGLAWMAEQGYEGVVTADADGQHSLEDILRVARALASGSRRLVLGIRDVSRMPNRSRTGNCLTRTLFRLLYGIKLQDTQTGLRGIPLTGENRSGLLSLTGERYEYEMEMLIEAGELFPAGIQELEIETIYLEDSDTSSHFRPLADGARIYSVLFRHFPRFFLSSILAFLVDYSLFNLLYYLLFHRSVPAAVLARVVSAGVNYTVNRKLVFGSSYHLLGYVKICLVILLAGSGLMYLLVDCLSLPAFLVKPLVDCGLYVLSFAAQNRMAQ
ncbi:MAG: glycosyltransferase [Lawsonibacter sp.]|jgi:glycosyltransferase involved in cell wall biosynthesis|nr:glycosyltransferase [Lawsonibacter sp.]MCI9027145.1 glycosyltransferase [Lawsonibacter sp.]MCI9655176.1 glycosyltransferase [Lawsonibacter sp.]